MTFSGAFIVDFEHILDFWSVSVVNFEQINIACWQNSLHRSNHCSLKKLSQGISNKSFENNLEGAQPL